MGLKTWNEEGIRDESKLEPPVYFSWTCKQEKNPAEKTEQGHFLQDDESESSIGDPDQSGSSATDEMMTQSLLE